MPAFSTFSHSFSASNPRACVGDQPGADDLADQRGQVGSHQIHLGLEDQPMGKVVNDVNDGV